MLQHKLKEKYEEAEPVCSCSTGNLSDNDCHGVKLLRSMMTTQEERITRLKAKEDSLREVIYGYVNAYPNNEILREKANKALKNDS